jgi:restriction endonuclease S subunit
LLRKTGKGIKLAIDYYNRWVTQVIYFFKLKDNTSISLEYLLGVLNSSLLQKYFFLKHADPYRNDFPHLTQKVFLRLPIKIPRLSFEHEIANQIHNTAITLQSEYQRIYDQKIDSSEEILIDRSIAKLERKMNNLVFSIYQLTSDQQDQIRSLFPKILD